MSSMGKCGKDCCLNFYMENGECIACPDGKFGNNCTSSCPDGYYGRLCITKCKCSEENCNPVTGCIRNPEISSINPQQVTDSSSAFTSNPNTTIVIVASIICLTIIVIAAMVIFKLKRSNGESQERRSTKEQRDIGQQNKTGTLNVSKTPCTHRYEDDNTYDSVRESQMMQGNITDKNRLSHKKKGKNYFDSKKTSPMKKGNNKKRGKRTLQNFK